MSLIRIQNELNNLQQYPSTNCITGTINAVLSKWQATIIGPIVYFYSFTFITKIFHYNINEYGTLFRYIKRKILLYNKKN